MVLVLIYCSYLLFHSVFNNNSSALPFIRKFAFAWIFFIPAVINDTFLLETTGIKTFPAVYAVCGIAFLKYFSSGRSDVDITEGNPVSGSQKLSQFCEKYGLSAREYEIAGMLIEGAAYNEIADDLFISVNTVKAHIKSIYPKFGVSRRHDLVKMYSAFNPGSDI